MSEQYQPLSAVHLITENFALDQTDRYQKMLRSYADLFFCDPAFHNCAQAVIAVLPLSPEGVSLAATYLSLEIPLLVISFRHIGLEEPLDQLLMKGCAHAADVRSFHSVAGKTHYQLTHDFLVAVRRKAIGAEELAVRLSLEPQSAACRHITRDRVFSLEPLSARCTKK